MLIKLGPEVCQHFEAALEREWIETNGRGGFSSGTVAGPRTRRYHALLIAALKPPLERRVLLAGLDEFLVTRHGRWPLSTQEYGMGTFAPDGHRHLVEFQLNPWPVWSYRFGPIRVDRELFLAYGQDTLAVRYKITGEEPGATLEIRPFLAYRDYHHLTRDNPAADRSLKADHGCLAFQMYPEMPTLYIGHSEGAFQHEPDWYRNFQCRVEEKRGLDHTEDLMTPGVLRLNASGRKTIGLVASTTPTPWSDAEDLGNRERKRRKTVAGALNPAPRQTQRLLLAADHYLVARGSDKRTVIAGYPWFGDWGRDTLISLPGLCLVTKRFSDAREILRSFATFIDKGMIPNRFPDEGETPEYNTIDASLWFFIAVQRYFEATGDKDLVAELLPKLEKMIAAHIDGTRYGIHCGEDGLLSGGESGVQLTWMDAKVGDWVVTPRMGKPVEINALWYNALRIMEEFERKAGRLEAQGFQRRADRVKRSFASVFWNDQRRCLYDGIDPNGRPDPAMRPNQVFALALPHRLLSPEQEKAVLEAVEFHLVTPFGLRSLGQEEPGYVPRYQGGVRDRDGAYHQGTIWGWLIGPYVDACLNVRGKGRENLMRLAELLEPLENQLDQGGQMGIAEIFDGDPPHKPRGAPWQAWSVAEVLRSRVTIQTLLDQVAPDAQADLDHLRDNNVVQ